MRREPLGIIAIRRPRGGGRARKHNLTSLSVARSDGVLIGILQQADVEGALHELRCWMA